MKIALDFDGTFTAAPLFWWMFVEDAIHKGHDVRIVTARDERNDGIDWGLIDHTGRGRQPCPVIFCDGRIKRTVCRDIIGWEPDIWIDDNPAAILFATSFTSPLQLAAWRATDEYRGSKLPITGESRGFAGRPQEGVEPFKPILKSRKKANG